MKYEINDVTFLIPIRLDSIERLENLMLSLKYLLKNFDTNILVLEAACYNNGFLKKILDKKIKYLYVEDKDPIFYRTKYLNIMASKVSTRNMALWDADIIISKTQIFDSVMKLREGYQVAYPYDGTFFDTTDILRQLYLSSKKLSVLNCYKNCMVQIYGNQMKGGAVFVEMKAFEEAGSENEDFYGWGPEDYERFERWKNLEYKIYRSPGCLFHLTHPRGINSSLRSENQSNNTNRIFSLIINSSKSETLKIINK